MSKVLTVLPILFLISIGIVYADNPTPFEEFDFNFIDIEIYQNPNNLRELIIKPHVFFEGNADLGSVNLEAIITDPDGYPHPQTGRINDMADNSERSIYWTYHLPSEGTYTIDLVMTNTSIEYPDHIFDEKTILYTVNPNGFERLVDSVMNIGEDGNDVFMLRTFEPIKKFERAHIIFDLPEKNLYEGIGVTNGEFKKTFDVGIKELFLESEFGYDDLEIYLIKEGNLFQFANAQSELLDYVTFYAIHKNICYSEICESVDYKEPEEKSHEDYYWLLGIIPAACIIGVVIYLKQKSNSKSIGWGKPYVSK